MKIFRPVFVVLIILGGWNILGTMAFGDVYHGTVVDEETGDPLEGASVSVIWYRTPIIQLAGSLYFQNAQETVTDANGKFSLEVSPGIDWSPFTTVVKEQVTVIYKPGYGPFAPGRMPRKFWEYSERVAAFRKGATIKLVKDQRRNERIFDPFFVGNSSNASRKNTQSHTQY